ncbi:MAG: glycosyltransferase [Deltaproteobacteria bacterium]|nr:glycosyltransferase [Deltaproteobacteria bacterium]
MPDVAVIIPVHNAGATLGETLDSLRLQRTDPGTGARVDLEVVVIDDRSTDDGPALARAHPLVTRVITSPAPGISPARNEGVRASQAPSVVFLDGDDLLLPGCLPRRLARARQEEAHDDGAVIFGRNVERWGPLDKPAALRALGEPRATLLRGNLLPPCAGLVSRRLLERVEGPFTEGLFSFEDWDLWLRLAFAGTRFVLLDEVDCVYRMRSEMMNHRPRAVGFALEVVDRIEPLVRAAPDARTLLPLLQRTRMELLLWRASFDYRARDASAVAHDLLEAGRASPRDVGRIPLHLLRRAWSHARRSAEARRVFGAGTTSPAARQQPVPDRR